MKRVAPRTNEQPDVTRIPQVVRIVIVRVEPKVVIITIEVEQVEIAIGVSFAQNAIQPTTLQILSGLYIIWDLKSISTLHQVSSFFMKCLHTSRYLQS